MTDYFGFTMASLNENGSVFANPCKGEKNTSTLMHRPFSSWANNSEVGSVSFYTVLILDLVVSPPNVSFSIMITMLFDLSGQCDLKQRKYRLLLLVMVGLLQQQVLIYFVYSQMVDCRFVIPGSCYLCFI